MKVDNAVHSNGSLHPSSAAIRLDGPSPPVPNLLGSLFLHQKDASQETQRPAIATTIAIGCFQLRCSIGNGKLIYSPPVSNPRR
jgi:hypothetical protein